MSEIIYHIYRHITYMSSLFIPNIYCFPETQKYWIKKKIKIKSFNNIPTTTGISQASVPEKKAIIMSATHDQNEELQIAVLTAELEFELELELEK